jgi:hypothetical protein
MPRKRSAGSEASPKAASNGTQQTTPANKTEAVVEALAAGITSPTEIASYIKGHFGLTITPAHVSTIKGNLKRARKGKKKAGRNPARKPAPAGQSAATVTKPAPRSEGGLTAKDLASLLDMARKAGGFDVLQEFVEVLRR